VPPPPYARKHLHVVESATHVRPLSSLIAAAIDEMCDDLERYHVRQEQRLNLTRCIAAADELIRDLEDLALAGETAVPAAWQPRLDRFASQLPIAAAEELSAGTPPTRLLDQDFDVEERLFALKLGEWARILGVTPEGW
jgi:hypothetical protein